MLIQPTRPAVHHYLSLRPQPDKSTEVVGPRPGERRVRPWCYQYTNSIT